MPLTPEQEQALTVAFEPAVKLLSNSFLPDYVPGIKTVLDKFIEDVKSDCDDEFISFDAAEALAGHLREYLEYAIKLNGPESNAKAITIRNCLKYNQVGLGGKGRQLMGLVTAGCFFSVFWLWPYLSDDTPSNVWGNGKGFLLGGVTLAAGLLGSLVGAPMVARQAINGQFTRVTDNIHGFFNKMTRPPLAEDELTENYFELANKILTAVWRSSSKDALINLINRNMQNMHAQDKVIKDDIDSFKKDIDNVAQGKFLQRLLDVYVDVNNDPYHKVTLREYLRTTKQPQVPGDQALTRANSRLAEVEGIINDKLVDLTRDDSELESIVLH